MRNNDRAYGNVFTTIHNVVKSNIRPDHVKKKDCPFRKSYPDVLVMQPTQDRIDDNGTGSLNCSVHGRIFL